VVDTAPHESDDERDDLAAALDFSAPEPAGSDLDALEVYAPAEEEPAAAVVTVTNPPGSVTVSAYLDGRVKRIDLSHRASQLTESELAAEIVVIAGLAAQDAKSAQYAVVLEGMRERGHDDAATRDFLSRDFDLPSPEQAQAERARVFSTRYPGDHD
jgi:hypothetical protein